MLAFVDESGFPHPNDPCERSVLLAVCTPNIELNRVIKRMYNLRMDIYNDPGVELKASKMLARRSLEKRTSHKIFIERVVDEVLTSTINLKVFAIIMRRPVFVPDFPVNEFPNHYRYLLQRINGYAKRLGKRCIVAFDSQDEVADKVISNKLRNYLFRSAEGQSCTNIVETAFFVSSKVEDGIQLADLCVSIVRQYHELMDADDKSEYAQWIAMLYRKVRALTLDVTAPNGHSRLQGFYEASHPNFFREGGQG